MLPSLPRVAGVLAVFACVACQSILGIEERELDPIKTGVCELPTEGSALVRFGNLQPNATNATDLCLTPSGSEPSRGVLRGAGTACPAGFRYTEISRLFRMNAGSYDLKLVRYGERCDGGSLAEARGVVLAANTTTTIVQMGAESGPSTLRAFSDASKLEPRNTAIRFINAIPSGPALDFGISPEARPPTKIAQKLFATPIAFGESSAGNTAAGAFAVNTHGHVFMPTAGTNVAAAPAGTTSAILASGLPGADSVLTIYAIGDPAQPLLPVRALRCDDLAHDSTPFATCSLSALSTLSIDMISAGLFGGVAKLEIERRGPLFAKIVERDSDLICVTQVGRRADKADLIARAKSRFPHSVTATTDLDTKPTIGQTLAGTTPAAPTTPACGGSGEPTKMKALLDCLSSKCTTTGTDDGTIKSSGVWTKPNADCLSESCVSEYIALMSGDTPEQRLAHARCYDCTIATFLSDKTMREVRDFCTKDPRDGLSFDGETPSLILSRFAMTAKDSFILPSTMYRRAVHFARVEIEPGKELDFYCGHVNANFGELVPYGGLYSNKTDPRAAWLEERALQTKRIMDWVREKSGTRPVVLAGEWDSSNEIRDASGAVVIDAADPDVVDALETVFTHAVPPGKVPECTMCPENLVGNATRKLLPTRVYTLGPFPAAATTEFATFFKEAIVPAPGGGLAHLSGVYGLNVRVKRP